MASQTPLVSVLVATYGRPDLLPRALRSAAFQTLPTDQYEVVVIANGPHRQVPAVVAAVRSAHPRVRFRLVETASAGAAHARNLGLLAARGQYFTILDDDDWISPAYLEGLLSQIRTRVVPLGGLAEIHPGQAEPNMGSYFARAARPHKGRVVTPAKLHQGISINVCKLLPTELGRQVLYDESLRSGEDFVFWSQIFARSRFKFSVLPGNDVLYYRWFGQNSLSRQNPSFDFNVVQRLDCMQALDKVPASPSDVEVVLEKMMSGQVGFVQRYLLAHPQDMSVAKTEYERRNIRRVPWNMLVS